MWSHPHSFRDGSSPGWHKNKLWEVIFPASPAARTQLWRRTPGHLSQNRPRFRSWLLWNAHCAFSWTGPKPRGPWEMDFKYSFLLPLGSFRNTWTVFCNMRKILRSTTVPWPGRSRSFPKQWQRGTPTPKGSRRKRPSGSRRRECADWW